jgi:hypothetical protein
MGTFSIQGSVMYQWLINWGYGWYRNITIPHWLDTQGRQRRMTFWIDSITERICEDWWINMYRIAIAVNILGPRGMQCFEFIDLYLDQWSHRKIFRMDLVVGLPECEGFEAVWVVVDRLSKMRHCIPFHTTTDAIGLARLFLQEVVCLHDLPKTILSDGGSQCASTISWQICNQLGIDW